MKNNVKTAVLLAAMGALIMGIGSFFGQGGDGKCKRSIKGTLTIDS